MGMLVDGKWEKKPLVDHEDDGAFDRDPSVLRNWVTADGSPGPTGDGGYAAERGRYHLYVSYACPWAHRTLIFRKIKKLEDIIGLSVVHWHMGENGWTFEDGPGVVPDPINNADFLHQVYTASEPDYTGKVTVPVLWDRETGRIVSNESADIIRMMNSAFDEVGAAPGDYYPEGLRDEIDQVNDCVYETVNNGVYKTGFASSQEAYEDAVYPLFETLDGLDARLAKNRYLMGDRVTEADWRLLTTLFRFDAVYYSHFKCNLRRLIDYPNLWPYTRDLYQHDGVSTTVHLDHIKGHYYTSQPQVDPTGVVPAGPLIDFTAPARRDKVSRAKAEALY